MSSTDRGRLDSQRAYVLHSYPFRETSLVVEVFTRQHGRLGLVARGARRPRAALRGLLLAFQPLLLSWAGKSELRTLHKAEWQGGMPPLRGTALMCGFYMNELLVKLLARDDPHEALFDLYEAALQALATQARQEPVLRGFERALLRELGYAMPLDQDAESGSPVEPGARYVYVIERGPVRSRAGRGENRLELAGRTLLAMARDDYADPVTLQQSKALMRTIINHYLGHQTLHTRQLLIDLHQL
jgi:DNA repair protein RecO (recombination protein O)